jgi:hypothetical protein
LAHVETSKAEIKKCWAPFSQGAFRTRYGLTGFYVLYILCSRERKAIVIRDRTGETKTFKRVQRQVK